MALISRLALLLLAAQALWPQYVISTQAGTVHFMTGEVLIDGKPTTWTPVNFPQLRPNQVLATGGDGPAEILLGPGVFLRLGEHSGIRMIDTRLEDVQVEIQQGTVLVEVVEIPAGNDVHVRFGPTSTGFRGIGLHRIDAPSGQLRVFGGHTEVVAGNARVKAARGKVIRLDKSLAQSKFNPGKKDDLLLWAAQRSFALYLPNAKADSHQTNWEVRFIPYSRADCYNCGGGAPVATPSTHWDHTYYFNRDFGVTFFAGP